MKSLLSNIFFEFFKIIVLGVMFIGIVPFFAQVFEI